MSLVDHIQELFSDPSEGDVLLVPCDGTGLSSSVEGIRAYSCILGRCPVFRRMFAQEFKEGVERRAEVRVSSRKILEQLVRFLYTDQMDFSSDACGSWTLKDLFELAALIHMYEAPESAMEALAKELAWHLKEGGVDAALLAVDTATWCPVVCQLMGNHQVGAALAESLEKGEFSAAFKAVQQGLKAGIPPQTMNKIAGRLVKLLSFGRGHLMQVLMWSIQEASCRDPSLDWKNFRAASLAKVTGEHEELKLELGGMAEEAPTVELIFARGLVVAKFVHLASKARAPTSCSQCGSKTFVHSYSDTGMEVKIQCSSCTVWFHGNVHPPSNLIPSTMDLLLEDLYTLAQMHAEQGAAGAEGPARGAEGNQPTADPLSPSRSRDLKPLIWQSCSMSRKGGLLCEAESTRGAKHLLRRLANAVCPLAITGCHRY